MILLPIRTGKENTPDNETKNENKTVCSTLLKSKTNIETKVGDQRWDLTDRAQRPFTTKQKKNKKTKNKTKIEHGQESELNSVEGDPCIYIYIYIYIYILGRLPKGNSQY